MTRIFPSDDTAALIAEARALDDGWVERDGKVIHADAIAWELAAALEAAEKRIRAEVATSDRLRTSWREDVASAEAERDAAIKAHKSERRRRFTAETARDEYKAERDSLSALHEVATERTVQLAAVLERVGALVNATEPWGDSTDGEWVAALRNILASAPGDVLREHDAKVFDEGWVARAERDINMGRRKSFPPPPSLNPYRAALRVGANPKENEPECPTCGDPVEAGDGVTFTSDGSTRHIVCADAAPSTTGQENER